MISREGAKQRYVSKSLCPAQEAFIIDEIYDSIGSCGKCVSTFVDEEGQLWCNIHQSPCNVEDFCNYFERKVNDL